MPISNTQPSPLRALASTLAKDGKFDRKDAREILSKVVEDGTITAEEKKELNLIDLEHRSAVAEGNAGGHLWTVFSGAVSDAVLLKQAIAAEASGGRISTDEFRSLRQTAAADGVVTGAEAASLRNLAFQSFNLTSAARAELKKDSAFVHPEQRADLALSPPDLLKKYEPKPEPGEVETAADTGWTERTLTVENDDFETREVRVKRTFDDEGRVARLEINDAEADPKVTVRTYAYDDAGRLTNVSTGAGPDPSTSPSRVEQTYEYGPHGNLIAEKHIRHTEGEDAKTTLATHRLDGATGITTISLSGDLQPRFPAAEQTEVGVGHARPEGYPLGTVTGEQQQLDRSGLRRSTKVTSTPTVPGYPSLPPEASKAPPGPFLRLPPTFHSGTPSLDENGRVVRVDHENEDGKKSHFEIKYDESGRQKEILEFSGKAYREGLPQYKWSLEYDDQNRLVRETKVRIHPETEEVQENKTVHAEHSYADDGSKTVTKSNWEKQLQERSAFNAGGFLEKKTLFNAEGKRNFEEQYVLDNQNRLVELITTSGAEGQIQDIQKEAFTHRADGGYRYERTEWAEEANGTKGPITSRTEEFVDRHGRLTERSNQSFTFPFLFRGNDAFTTGTGEDPNHYALVRSRESYLYDGPPGADDDSPKLAQADMTTEERIIQQGEARPTI